MLMGVLLSRDSETEETEESATRKRTRVVLSFWKKSLLKLYSWYVTIYVCTLRNVSKEPFATPTGVRTTRLELL